MDYEQAKKHVTKKEITDLARELEQVHSDVLTAWDRAALHKVSEIEPKMEIDEFRDQLRRVFELAGLNYELEKQNFWSRYNHIKQQNDLND
jgi:hypothetical protein